MPLMIRVNSVRYRLSAWLSLVLGLSLVFASTASPSAQAQTTADTEIFLYLPLVSRNFFTRPGIYGQVTRGGTPAANVALTLRRFNGVTYETVATLTTDAQGIYAFTGVPGLTPGQTYRVEFANPSPSSDGRLMAWVTREISAYAPGDSVPIGFFDIAEIPLVAPAPGTVATFPVTFQWTLRPATPWDAYSFAEVYSNGDRIWESNDLGYTNTYTLTNSPLPPAFQLGAQHWTVYVTGPDGDYGFSFPRPITFSN
jgi:hypothetical protein